jgi:TolB-like protein/DNA-binding winged helix-turn-helix (wHTH) protein/Tfp pilus assembly protein PilF
MLSLISHLHRFGDFTLDARARVLRRGIDPVSLTPKAFEVLFLLVESAGEIVAKEELMNAVWPNSFVEESNLTQTIFMIRKALGETPHRRYIVTAQGKGYRFVCEVRTSQDNNIEDEQPQVPLDQVSLNQEGPDSRLARTQAIATEQAAGSSLEHPLVTKHLRSTRLLLAASILLSAGLGAWYVWSRSFSKVPDSGRVMLAVLPFQNFTGDPGQEYLSDGLTEEMLSQLGNLDPQHLGVIARTSIMHYKGSSAPLEQIARELGVQYVIEGSLRRDADRLRISVQFIQVRDQSHLWAREYDRELTGLLGVEAEIAQEVAGEIQLTLGKHESATLRRAETGTHSYEAYDFYLRGLYFLNKRWEGFPQAAEYFQQAIDKDPNYARAYAGLANTYALMSTWLEGKPDDLMPKARAAALKALQLDEKLPEAHVALALVGESYDYDWTTAEKEFRRAIELDPNYSTAHQWYGEGLSWQGRFAEALAESDRARQIDPVSLIVASDRGAVLFRARQYDRAIAQYRAVVEMDPRFIQAFDYLLFSYVRCGRFPEALDEINKYIRPFDPVWATGDEAIVYAQWGRSEEMKRALAKFEAHPATLQHNWYLRLKVSANTGHIDEAVSELQDLLALRSHVIPTLDTDPFYDALRADPRFDALLRYGRDR